MVQGSCDCGEVRIELADAPSDVTNCNCGICRRYGALWSYFQANQVRLEGATTVHKRGKRVLEFHFCTACGCVTHWCAVDKQYTRMGVNMRLFTPELLASLRVDQCDAASW